MAGAGEAVHTGADLVVDCLAAEEVELVAGVPGTTVMDLIDSFVRRAAIRFISTRHEQVAGFLADGWSRAGTGLGACMASRGPGAANLTIAVQNAYDESVPMLVLIGQVPSDVFQRRAFEEMDVVAAFRPMTKWAVEVPNVDRLAELLRRAAHTAQSGRPGPVVVSLPLDVLQSAAPEAVKPMQQRLSYPPAPAPAAIEQARSLLATAERPAILLGGGANGDSETYLELAAQISAPLLTTWLRQSIVRHDHAAYLGALGYGAHEVSEQVIRESDLLLAIGCRFSEFTTKRWTLVSSETSLVHIDIDPDELGRIYPPEVGVVADAQLAARALLDHAPRPDAERGSRRSARLEKLRGMFDEASNLTDEPERDEQTANVSNAGAVRVLQELVSRDGIVLVQDAPSFGPWSQRYLRLNRPRSLFGSAGGAMAWGLPAGMGIALARPEQRVVTVSGDGSFWMVAQDFETCVREGIPVINLVMNNFAYGNTRDRQRFNHDGRFLGVFYGNPDFAEFARSLGGYGRRAESDAELRVALDEALAQHRPAIVDVVQHPMAGLPPGLQPPKAQ